MVQLCHRRYAENIMKIAFMSLLSDANHQMGSFLFYPFPFSSLSLKRSAYQNNVKVEGSEGLSEAQQNKFCSS